jgi:hypothetical protein
MGCLAVGLVLFLCSCDDAKLSELERQNHELLAKLAQMKQASDREVRMRCSTQAAAKSMTVGYSAQRMSATNYYNVRLGTCFQRIDNTSVSGDRIITAIFLRDAFDGKEYGEFIRSLGPRESVDTVPVLCRVGLAEDEQSCSSPEEFTALARQYME